MALLSQAERVLLSGRKELSKTQRRYIRYKLRKKIKEFYNLEPPLLIENGYITADIVAANSYGVAASGHASKVEVALLGAMV